MQTLSTVEEDLPLLQKRFPGYDTKLHLMVRLQFWGLGSVVYPFIAITPSSTLIQSGNAC